MLFSFSFALIFISSDWNLIFQRVSKPQIGFVVELAKSGNGVGFDDDENKNHLKVKEQVL